MASFTGDNFGATYQGVSKDEVNALFYFDAPINDLGTSRGTEARPVGQRCPVSRPGPAPPPAGQSPSRAATVLGRRSYGRFRRRSRSR